MKARIGAERKAVSGVLRATNGWTPGPSLPQLHTRRFQASHPKPLASDGMGPCLCKGKGRSYSAIGGVSTQHTQRRHGARTAPNGKLAFP